MKALIGIFAYIPIYDHSSPIYNSKVMQVNQVSINRQRKKMWHRHTHTHTHTHTLLFCCSVVSNSVTHGLQHARLSCPSPFPWVFSNPCPLSWWCHTSITSSVVTFASCLQSFPESGSFLMSWVFASDDKSIGTSASTSVLPMNIQDWFPKDWLVWSPCSPRDSQASFLIPQFKRINSSALSFLYGPTLTSNTIGKTIGLTIQTFVGKIMSLLFNMLSRFVIAFLPRSKGLFISWL